MSDTHVRVRCIILVLVPFARTVGLGNGWTDTIVSKLYKLGAAYAVRWARMAEGSSASSASASSALSASASSASVSASSWGNHFRPRHSGSRGSHRSEAPCGCTRCAAAGSRTRCLHIERCRWANWDAAAASDTWA